MVANVRFSQEASALVRWWSFPQGSPQEAHRNHFRKELLVVRHGCGLPGTKAVMGTARR
jgi:hypothetical protein